MKPKTAMNRRYVDIHCHPSTKPFLKYSSGLNKKIPTLWDKINYKLFLWIDELFANDILDSQSSLSQLSKNNSAYSIVVNPVIPMERELARYTMFPLAIKLLLPFPRQITKSYFETMQSMDFPYSIRLEEELEFSSNTDNVHLITNENDQLDLNELNLILAIEGGHALYDSPRFDTPDNKVLQRLRRIREQHRLLYITISHLAPSPLANHCFSMKGVSKKKVHHFYPKKEVGISDIGLQIINECSEAAKPTCIDVKHMSLASRFQFYKYRKQQGHTTPIFASHNGAAGFSFLNWKEHILNKTSDWKRTIIDNNPLFSLLIDRPKGIELRNIQTVFNPATINLFDEDIEEIVLSDGLIGVSFDERILGRGTKSTFLEVLAEAELNVLLGFTPDIKIEETSLKKFNKTVNYYDVNMKQPTLKRSEIKRRKLRLSNTFKQATADALYLLNNLLYMVKVAKTTIEKHQLNRDPWQFFALGSDFDGVIDAIDSCKTAEKMADLEFLLQQLMIEYLTKNDNHETYGISKEDTYADVNQKINLLCHINAVNVIQRVLNNASN